MYARLNTLWARLLLAWGIPLVLFISVAAIASVVISRLFDARNWDNHSYAVIAKAMNQEKHLTQFRLAVYRVSLESEGFQNKCLRLHHEFRAINADLQQ